MPRSTRPAPAVVPPRRAPEDPARRRMLVAGLVLAGLGIAVLFYIGWQQVASNWWSWHRQDQLVEELERSWSQPAGDTGDTGDTGEADGSAADVGAIAVVRIPRFGAEYAVPVVEGVEDDDLALGLGHFPGTAGPGEPGNLALAGHRVGHGEPLRDLPDLQPGDEVVVETREAVHTYVVDTDPADLVLHPDADWVLDDRPVNPDGGPGPVAAPRLLTLVTCTDLFHSDDRTAVFGHLESSVAR